jgi:tetratricopeptide (TPR) repeat protein
MTSEADKLRFFEALFKVTEQRLKHNIKAIAIDDLQFMDAASLEALQLNTDRILNLGVRMFITCRKGELLPELEASFEQAASRGSLEIIDLEPLEETGLSELLQSLELDAPANLAAQLQRSTGGNPLYALETIRDLLEQNNLHENLERLPLPKVVQHITAQRLARRTPQAQRIAQVAAIAGEDFTLDLAAFVLESKPLELQAPLEELEQAQIMQRERFQHDLLLEAVKAGISTSIKRFLHRTCAAFLEEHGDSARVAQHWLEAGEYDRAVPAMLVAAETAQGMAHHDQAIKLLEQAISLPASLIQIHRAQAMLGGIYAHVLRFPEAEKLLEPLLEVVSDPEAHWLTLDHLCYLYLQKGSLEMAQEFGLQALQLAERRDVASNLEDTRYKLGVIAIHQADYEKAVQLIEPVVQAWRQNPVNLGFLNALGAMGLSLFHLERHSESKCYDDEMLRHARAIGADEVMIVHVTNQLYRDFLRGDARQSIGLAENLLTDLEQRHSLADTSGLRNNLAGVYSRLAQADHAIRHYQKIVEGTNKLYHCAAFANLAVLYFQTSKLELAQINLALALELAPDNDYHNVRYAVIRAAYTLGTPEQREIVKPYLETLNFEGLPSSYRAELDALLEKSQHQSI